MGDAQGQGRIATITIFLDENHCGNRHLHAALAAAGIAYEKHLDYFVRGAADTVWIPQIAARNWVLLTSDARIRYNSLERDAISENNLRMFYFTRNDIGGEEMGIILSKALPKMVALCANQPAPFIASVAKSGEVNLRSTLQEVSP